MSTPVSTRGSASASRSSSVVATKIFIDSVPEYYQLQSCAVTPVSAIVRAMASGCGDGSQMTSYVCFCYDSSTYYNSLIGAEVSTACNGQAQATSAQDVFSKYCQIGVTRGITPAAAVASATGVAVTSNSPLSSMVSSVTGSSSLMASSSSTNSVASATTTPSSLPSPKSSSDRTTKIAVGVVVPVVVIALIIGLYLAYRRRNRGSKTTELEDSKRVEMAGDSPTEKYRNSTAELANHTTYAELPGDRRSLVELPTPKDGTNDFYVHGGHGNGPKGGF